MKYVVFLNETSAHHDVLVKCGPCCAEIRIEGRFEKMHICHMRSLKDILCLMMDRIALISIYY